MKWQNPLLTLGERCVAFAENEMNNGVKEDSPGSFTSPRIREYFNVCIRKVNGQEKPVNFSKGNWCAASASFCMEQSLLPHEEIPHRCRLGVVEIISDMQNKGLWIPVDRVRNNKYNIQVGDLIMFDRSQPNKPETMWYRHIGRVYSISTDEFQCISGNSGGCWKISTHKLSQANLLGFGQYPSINSARAGQPAEPIDWSHVNINDLAPAQDTGHNLESDSFFSIYNSIFGK